MREDFKLIIGVIVFGWIGYWICRSIANFIFDYL